MLRPDFRRPLTPAPPGSPQTSSFPASDSRRSFGTEQQYATYVRLLTWFLDTPTAASPFSIHHFAAEGERLGKQVGEWFGPSTAAGAIAALANGFPAANIGVALAIDTTVYESEVVGVASGHAQSAPSPGLPGKRSTGEWTRPVLILVPLRLGLNGVNPIYHESIKRYFALPQCVGIAGGRPSSSYYFVGAQGDSLFYIDPHHAKPAVKSVAIADSLVAAASTLPMSPDSPTGTGDPERRELDDFFCSSYAMHELGSFHSEKVRKMAITGLDPSMLVGLLCRTHDEWLDLRARMKEMKASCTPLVHIMDEMPKWMRKGPGMNRTISGSHIVPVSPLSPSANAAAGAPASRDGGPSSVSESARLQRRGHPAEESFDDLDSDDWDIDESESEGAFGKSSDEDEEFGRAREEADSPGFGEVPGAGSAKGPAGQEDDWTEAAASARMSTSPPQSAGSIPKRHRREGTVGSDVGSFVSASAGITPPHVLPRRNTAADSPAQTLGSGQDLDAVIVSKAGSTPHGATSARAGSSVDSADRDAGWEGLARASAVAEYLRPPQISDESTKSDATVRK